MLVVKNDLSPAILDQVCPYCKGCIIGESIVSCPNCNTFSHKECWSSFGCSVYGCIGNNTPVSNEDNLLFGWPLVPGREYYGPEIQRKGNFVVLKTVEAIQGRIQPFLTQKLKLLAVDYTGLKHVFFSRDKFLNFRGSFNKDPRHSRLLHFELRQGLFSKKVLRTCCWRPESQSQFDANVFNHWDIYDSQIEKIVREEVARHLSYMKIHYSLEY